jgi:hypothetical protein
MSDVLLKKMGFDSYLLCSKAKSDKLNGQVDTFFQQCKKQKTEWKNENFEAIKKVQMPWLNTNVRVFILMQ